MHKFSLSKFIYIYIHVCIFFPPDISLTGTTFVNVGDPVFLVCNVSGGDYIPEDIDWFKDGNEIKSDAGRVKITKRQSVTTRSITSQLLIKHSYMTDAGNYICRSSMDITSLSVQVLNGRHYVFVLIARGA